MDEYDDTPRGFLSRARQCLENADPAQLFYAALELRFCVEARQDEYVYAQRRYIKSAPPAYRIGSQAAALRKLFNRDEILKLQLVFGDHPQPFVLYYTPVTYQLKNSAEKLGDLLHVQKNRRSNEDAWWTQARADLVKIYRGAWVACRGEMLSPLLLDRNGNAVGAIEFVGPRNDDLFERIQRKGRKFKLTVNYIGAPTPEFVPDL
jgi:hypothetical protein